MSDRVKIFTSDGVTIKVTMFNHRYEVEILIPKEKLKKEIHLKNKNLIFHFYMKNKCYEEIRIIFEKNYPRDAQGIVNISNHSKFEFNTKDYRGSITLSPKSYIPGKIIKSVKLEKEDRNSFANLLKKCGINNNPRPKPSPSIYTNYKYNNVTKPFNGGKVSPK